LYCRFFTLQGYPASCSSNFLFSPFSSSSTYFSFLFSFSFLEVPISGTTSNISGYQFRALPLSNLFLSSYFSAHNHLYNSKYFIPSKLHELKAHIKIRIRERGHLIFLQCMHELLESKPQCRTRLATLLPFSIIKAQHISSSHDSSIIK